MVGSFVVGAAAKEVGTSWSSLILIFGVVGESESYLLHTRSVMHVNKKIVMNKKFESPFSDSFLYLKNISLCLICIIIFFS